MKNQLKYYLSGPMTGLPEFNYPAFIEAAELLRNSSLEILSPHEITLPDPSLTYSWKWYMKRALRMELECDAIILLPGWSTSKGARCEFDVALSLEMELYTYSKYADGILKKMK